MPPSQCTRRQALAFLMSGGLCGLLDQSPLVAEPGAQITRPLSGGEKQARAAFPLRVDKGMGCLVDSNGHPFLVHGDTAWSLIADLSREDAAYYLEHRRSQGFNTILVNLIERRFARNAPRDFYGAAPFAVPGDFSTPNKSYFDNADWVLERAATLGFLVLLTPAYLGFDGGSQGWYQDMQACGQEKLRAYGRFVGGRYARFNNIVWMHGGDYNPPDRELVRTLVSAIRESNPTALHSAHCAPENIASSYWGRESWLDLNTLYTYGPIGRQARKAMAVRDTWPFILLESAYENEQGADELRVRMQAYQALLSGACGHVYGNNPIWHFEAPGIFESPVGWRNALNSRGAKSMTHLVDLFSTISWWKLRPDNDSRLLVYGGGSDKDRAAAAWIDDGSLALIYAPGPRTLGIDTRVLKGAQVRANWFDPSSGESHPNAIPFWINSGVKTLPTPDVGSAGGPDWILALRPVR